MNIFGYNTFLRNHRVLYSKYRGREISRSSAREIQRVEHGVFVNVNLF